MCSRTTHSLVAVGAEQASVVAFLHHDVGDAWLILLLKADTGLTDGQQLIIQHLRGEIKTKLKAASSVDGAATTSPKAHVKFRASFGGQMSAEIQL